LFVGLSKLTRELTENALRGRSERFEFVEAPAAPGRLRAAIDAVRPDFVIVPADDDGLPEDCRRFLEEQARVKVVAIEEGHGGAFLYQLVPDVAAIVDVLPDELAEAIAAVAGAVD